MENKDFKKYFSFKPDWIEMSFQVNTESKYADKQSLTALFWNTYVYFEDKTIKYFSFNQTLPLNEIHELIFQFRQHFPLKNRVEGVNYFDDLVLNLVEKLQPNEKLKSNEQTSSTDIQKLKWNCPPSVLGWLITELANKGYIEYPLYNGEPNPTGLAKTCFGIFELDTTKENLIKEFNSNKNTLSDTKIAKFTIPVLKDLS